jgi:hypothetical protein
MGWYSCWNNAGAVAQTSYGFGGIQILAHNYNINVWPGSRSTYVSKAPLNNLGFTVQATDPLSYNNAVGGCFQTQIDCAGTGNYVNTGTSCTGSGQTNVLTQNYNADYTVPEGGSSYWIINAFGVNSCNYQNPGVYRTLISVNGGGSTGPQYGAANVIVFPQKPLSVNVIATPSSGGTPLNNVKISADAEGIMPAGGPWGPVSLTLRCDGNLKLEQALAAGADPTAAQTVDGSDGSISDAYYVNFNSQPMTSSIKHDFSCSYATAGTRTPTVVVSQNSGTAAGGTNVYAIGQLDCTGNGAPLTAPADFNLKWNTQNTTTCNAGVSIVKSYSGVSSYTNATNWATSQLPVGNQTFLNVPEGNYIYSLTCTGNVPTDTVESTCAVQVNPKQ